MPELYAIDVSPEAETDIEEVLLWLNDHLPHFTQQWLDGLEAALATLSRFPERCPVAPESASPDYAHELRQLLYGEGRSQYRILFWLDTDIVRVFRVRHSARLWLHENPEGD